MQKLMIKLHPAEQRPEMPSRMIKSLTTFAILESVSACCSTAPYVTIEEPKCEVPVTVTEEAWNDLRKLREVMSHNSLVDGDCIERLRKRIEAHNAGS